MELGAALAAGLAGLMLLGAVLRRRLRRSPSQPSVQELSYFAAFDFLPTVFLSDPEKFWRGQTESEKGAGLLYLMLCGITQREPDEDELSGFSTQRASLADGREVLVVCYPPPNEFQFSEEELEGRELGEGPYLGVYMTALVLGNEHHVPSVYTLSQSPLGKPALRRCTRAGHYNLGAGSIPKPEEFVSALETAEEREVIGGFVRAPQHMSEVDEALCSGLESYAAEEIAEKLQSPKNGQE